MRGGAFPLPTKAAPTLAFPYSSTSGPPSEKSLTCHQNERQMSVTSGTGQPCEYRAPEPGALLAADQSRRSEAVPDIRKGSTPCTLENRSRNHRRSSAIQRNSRSEPLYCRLQDRHALHVRGHRKDVGLDTGRKAAGQRCMWVPNEGRRAPGASNERHGPTSIRRRQSGASCLPTQRLPRYGASRRWRHVGAPSAYERLAVEGAV